MLRTCLHSFFLLATLMVLSNQVAFAATPIDVDTVTICPASLTDRSPPDFQGTDCKAVKAHQIDPQNRLIWVKARIVLEDTSGPKGEPLGLLVAGKMASEFYLNGEYVGRNGIPGDSPQTETPGKMDTILYAPQTLYRIGDNEIVFRASAHHGFLKLAHPIHVIAIGSARNITSTFLAYYWPSLVTLGLFVLGMLYFGIIGVIGSFHQRPLVLSLICSFAAAQLLTEVFRGLYAYAYPVHDLRLVLITLFSAGFGLSVAYYVLATFTQKYLIRLMIGAAALILIGVSLMRGFDGKAAIAMLIPLCVSLLMTGFWSYQRKPRAFGYFLSLLTFVAAIFVYPSLFLDVVFFYLVAAFLLFLLIEQGLVLVREERQRRIETARADRLQLALDQASEREDSRELVIKSAGKIDRIATNQIMHCRGAGGYAEIILTDGREILHAATLTELEDIFPSTFLRVHRSHLVNIAFVKSLTRDPSGTGTLALTDGTPIPVSRRVMPHVRQTLG